ncbi:MAG: hypothetical protein N2047_06255 [Meiothermus sp.]|jgi:pilus assembly protein TadC|nr:hypothetical protein [Meiothermus sp.]
MRVGVGVRLGRTEAWRVPLGWEVAQKGDFPEFRRLMDLLMEVEAAGMPLEEAAQKYGAVVVENEEG